MTSLVSVCLCLALVFKIVHVTAIVNVLTIEVCSDPSTFPPKIQDILQDIWKKNTGHFTGLQKPISLHLLGIIVSQQYSITSDVGG